MNSAHPRSRLGRRLKRVVHWIALRPSTRDGFVDPDTASLPDGHLLALVSFAESAALYAVIGAGKYARLGWPTCVSTPACVLLLVMLCRMATGVSFFFDHYRVPVLIPESALGQSLRATPFRNLLSLRRPGCTSSA